MDKQQQEQKIVQEYFLLVEKSQQLFAGLRDLPQFGRHWQPYFQKTFEIYTKLWKYQQQHRAVLENVDIYGLKRWEIGEIASKIGQLYYHYYLRTSETSYIEEAFIFYEAIRHRDYFKDVFETKNPLLVVKKLRYYARFIVVCLLLNRRVLVVELVEELQNLVDEYIREFKPADAAAWRLVLQEITLFLQVDSPLILNDRNRDAPPISNRLKLPPSNVEGKVRLQEAILVGNYQNQVKFSELTLDMFRIMQALERERVSGLSRPSDAADISDEKHKKRSNPHKFLLYRPSFAQLLVFLSTAFKELQDNNVLLLYISADGLKPVPQSLEEGRAQPLQAGGLSMNTSGGGGSSSATGPTGTGGSQGPGSGPSTSGGGSGSGSGGATTTNLPRSSPTNSGSAFPTKLVEPQGLPTPTGPVDAGMQVEAEVDIPFPPRRVYLRSKDGRYLTARSDGRLECVRPPPPMAADGREMAQPYISSPNSTPLPNSGSPGFEAAWDMEFENGGLLTLRSNYGKYLSMSADGQLHMGTDNAAPNQAQKFKYVIDDAHHSLVLISQTGCYIYADPDGRLLAASALVEHPFPGDVAGSHPQNSHLNPEADDDDDDDNDDDDEEIDDKDDQVTSTPEGEALRIEAIGRDAQALLQSNPQLLARPSPPTAPPATPSPKTGSPNTGSPSGTTRAAEAVKRAPASPLKMSSDTAFYNMMSRGSAAILQQPASATNSSSPQNQINNHDECINDQEEEAEQDDQDDEEDDVDDDEDTEDDDEDDDDEDDDDSQEEVKERENVPNQADMPLPQQQQSQQQVTPQREEPASHGRRMTTSIRMPREEEVWRMEIAPSREAEQAIHAQNVWQQAAQSRLLFSLSSSLSPLLNAK